MTTKKFIATEIPTWNSVKYYNARIQPSEAKDLSAQTDYQWQIIKTRFLIWKYDNLLAAPASGQPGTIHIIVPNIDAENGTLVEFAKESNIKLIGPFYLPEETYQLCITYSIGFRLCPLWNKVGGLWINSYNFLTSVQHLPAIVWEPNVAGGYLRSTVQATRARLNFLDLKDYQIDVGKLKTCGQMPICGEAYVLPNQRLCRLVNVLTTIPYDCPFPTYTLMRKHWKNTYGLRLPRDGSSMLYVQVCFGRSNDLYTYPILCVRPSKLRRLPSRDVMETVTAFTVCITERCKNICGMPIAFKIFDDESPAPIIPSSQMKSPVMADLRYKPSLVASVLSQPLPEKAPQPDITSWGELSESSGDSGKELFRRINEDVERLSQHALFPSFDKNHVSPMQQEDTQVKPKFVPTFNKQRPVPAAQGMPNTGQLPTEAKTAKLQPVATTANPAPVLIAKQVANPPILQNKSLHKIKSDTAKSQQTPLKTTVPSNIQPNLLIQATQPIATKTPELISSLSNSVPVLTQEPTPIQLPVNINSQNMTANTQAEMSMVNDLLQVPPVVKNVAVKTTPAKKSRTSITPVDVAALAMANNVHKANIFSLKEFLKEKKIGGYSKDKKEVLIEKVYRYYGMSVPNVGKKMAANFGGTLPLPAPAGIVVDDKDVESVVV